MTDKELIEYVADVWIQENRMKADFLELMNDISKRIEEKEEEYGLHDTEIDDDTLACMAYHREKEDNLIK